jgi:hypothetical protein
LSLQGVDYSFGRPGGAALAAAGKRFAMRYVPYVGDHGKGLTSGELADLHDHDVAVGLVLELGGRRALLGRLAGKADAELAHDALGRLGFPADRPVYFAVDFDASGYQQAAIDAYLDGAAEFLGTSRIGVYGSVDVVDRCAENSSARWFWQTYAWSGGAVSSRAHLLQYHNGQTINGAAVDLCRSLEADFGVWLPRVMGPGPQLPPEEEEIVHKLNSNGLLEDGRPLTAVPVAQGAKFTTVDGVVGTFSEAATLPVYALVDSDDHTYLVVVHTHVGWADGIARDTPVILATNAPRVAAAAPAPSREAIAAAVGTALDHVKAAHDAEGVAIAEARTV